MIVEGDRLKKETVAGTPERQALRRLSKRPCVRRIIHWPRQDMRGARRTTDIAKGPIEAFDLNRRSGVWLRA